MVTWNFKQLPWCFCGLKVARELLQASSWTTSSVTWPGWQFKLPCNAVNFKLVKKSDSQCLIWNSNESWLIRGVFSCGSDGWLIKLLSPLLFGSVWFAFCVFEFCSCGRIFFVSKSKKIETEVGFFWVTLVCNCMAASVLLVKLNKKLALCLASGWNRFKLAVYNLYMKYIEYTYVV